jgi:tetratricopeptide (TPR) repeat protein
MRNPELIIIEQDELLALARMDVEKGQLESALIKLKQILAEESPIADAISMLARLYAQLGLYSKAQQYFKKYVEVNPEAEIEYFQLGMTYFEAGQNSEAEEIWNDILTKKATHPPSLYYKSLSMARSKKSSGAKETLGVLLKSVSPDNLYFQRGKELLAAIEAGKNVHSIKETGSTKNEKSNRENNKLSKLYETEY